MMRRAYYGVAMALDSSPGSANFGKPWGVALGHDFCSEHEWGISGIHDAFGIEDSNRKFGVEARRITKVPGNEWLWWVSMKDRKGILLSRGWHDHRKEENPFQPYWNQLGLGHAEPGLAAGWDGSSFCITSDDPGQISFLRQLYDSFEKKDVVIGVVKSFMGVSLMVAIASRIPPEIAKEWEGRDREYAQLQKDFKKTGIEKLLAKKGKGYFALTPKRKKDGSLMFWLNPLERDDNHYGWFTLRHLKEWAEGKGCIPIDKTKSGGSRG